MTLDLTKFISNSIKTQAKIQHLDVSTKTTKSVPSSVKTVISKEYGDNYLLDADYVSFFWGAIGKEEVKKLFNVVDKALGKSANKLTETDFKKIPLGASEEDDEPEEEELPEEQKEQEEQTEETAEETASEEQETSTEEQEDELNEDEEQEAPKKTSYFFLKITLK